MEAKDIYRLVLFFLIAIFALYSGSFIKVRKTTQIKNQEENEETGTQKLLNQSHDSRKRINQEPMVYDNENTAKEKSI